MEEYSEDDEIEIDADELLEREDEEHSRCWCGAWVLSKKTGHYVCVADCVCGA